MKFILMILFILPLYGNAENRYAENKTNSLLIGMKR